MAVKTAIEFPKTPGLKIPLGYSQYTLEAGFYDRLGWTYEDLDTRPRKQVKDYITIITLIANHEKEEMDRAKAGNS